jgi:hypothetical protein
MKSKEMALLLKIRAHETMPMADLIEYVRRCLRNGGIDLSLISIDPARQLDRSGSLQVTGVAYTNKSQGAQKNIDNDRAPRQNPTTITQ